MAYSDVQNIASEGIYGPIALDTAFPQATKAVWLSTAGNITFIGSKQTNTQVLTNAPISQWIPLSAKQINTSGTTAVIALVLYSRPSQS